jgi:TIR domain
LNLVQIRDVFNIWGNLVLSGLINRVLVAFLPFRLRVVVGYGGTRALAIARELHDFLPSKFIKWIAWRHAGTVVAGEDFEPEIDKRIADSDVLLMVWTSESLASPEANRELAKARELVRTVMPFVEKGAPLSPLIDPKQNIEFDNGNAEAQFGLVVSNLEAVKRTKEEIWKVRVRPA